MAAITINITEQQLQKLQSLAPKLGISTEELLSASLEDLLNYPKSEFNQAASYVLRKKAELYQLLAWFARLYLLKLSNFPNEAKGKITRNVSGNWVILPVRNILLFKLLNLYNCPIACNYYRV